MKNRVPDGHKTNESGNVLFLILIAVVLFAALSYAVTRSTRTPDDGADNTINGIRASAIVQYPAGIRTSLMRMIMNGMGVSELKFNAPAAFSSLPNDAEGVFHPAGGSATYETASHDAMASGTEGTWHFNAEFEVDNIGLDTAGDFPGNDLVAFLPGIRQGICARINEDIGLSAIPNSSADLSGEYTVDMDDTYALPADETMLGTEGANNTDPLTGQPFGCFQNNGGEYVYYHVLVER